MGNKQRTGSAAKIKLDSFENLIGGSAGPGDFSEQVVSIPLCDLHDFKAIRSGWPMMKRWRKQQRA